MTTLSVPKLEISVSSSDKTLTLVEMIDSTSTTLLTASIVSGFDETGTPAGLYKAGKWIKDKTNPTHGPTPWSKDPWGNPYGSYFIPLNDAQTQGNTLHTEFMALVAPLPEISRNLRCRRG